MNGIYTAQTGIPLAITNGNNNSQIGSPGQRPNNNGTSAKKSGPIDQRLNAAGQIEYFDPKVFSAAPNFTFGTSGRFSPDLRQPSQFIADLSLFKNFVFREKLTTQFRAEAFNAFNHSTWAAPGTAVNNPGTFGIITGVNNSGGLRERNIQLALRVNF